MMTAFHERRLARGLTQRRLAAMAGVTQSAVRKWDAGLSSPDPSRYPALALALGLPAVEVVRMFASQWFISAVRSLDGHAGD